MYIFEVKRNGDISDVVIRATIISAHLQVAYGSRSKLGMFIPYTYSRHRGKSIVWLFLGSPGRSWLLSNVDKCFRSELLGIKEFKEVTLAYSNCVPMLLMKS